MTAVTIDEIQRDLRGYLHRVEAGETVTVVYDDRPIAELKPVEGRSVAPRPIGLCEGQFAVPDHFDDPLPDNVLADFEGKL